ncbi:uncharacterized protein G2W53_000529 [Senna tora]|uniref:Uncharacterized protein n=1 Tax=Senna tora TaxID=362788 RepID=A0A834XE17_9FABA|nr:uncharacterized protein G2W53_000529 [Senna tora]
MAFKAWIDGLKTSQVYRALKIV